MLGLARDLVRQVRQSQHRRTRLFSACCFCNANLSVRYRPLRSCRQRACRQLPKAIRGRTFRELQKLSFVLHLLTSQAMTVAKPETAHLVAMLARFTIAMPYLLHHHVTEFKGLPPQLQVRPALL